MTATDSIESDRGLIRTPRRLLPIVTTVVLSLGLAGCAGERQEDEDGAGELNVAQPSNAPGSSVTGVEEGEESGMIARTAMWDRMGNGARLMLQFNASSNAFVGRVENTSNDPLCAFRVEVHLDTGVELGPTEPTDIPYTRSINVSLPTGGQEFSTWTAHPEISPCENQ